MQRTPTIDERRSFLKYCAGGLLSAMGLSGCGPAHKVGEEFGLCCKKDRSYARFPKPGAPVLAQAGTVFNESRLIEKINSKEPIYDPDPDLLGFVNKLYEQVHGFPVPSHLTYEFTNPSVSGIVGQYVDGHLIIGPGLSMDICIHTLLHEIGHDHDTITWSEAVAEFESSRDTLEGLVLHPGLNKETDYALLRYSNKWAVNWGPYGAGNQYGSASILSYLATIKNRGDLALAQNDVNLFFLSQVDAERVYNDNNVGRGDMSSRYFMDELKDMAMAAWFGAHEQEVAAENKDSLVRAMRFRETTHDQNLVLPPGIVVPVNYSDYLSRPIA